MVKKLSRKDFLKLGMTGMAALSFSPLPNIQPAESDLSVARVSTASLSVYSRPDDTSTILYQRFRDELVNIYYDVVSEAGPEYNPLWYRVWGGYMHSAHLVKVTTRYNPVEHTFPEAGSLATVTVPYTQSMVYSTKDGWQPMYRLYEGSNHWVLEVTEGPDGLPWYRIEDEMDVYYTYFAPAHHFHIVTAEEISPISPDLPHHAKRIEVSLVRQVLTAFEWDQVVLETKISSGIPYNIAPPGSIPTRTPKGTFNVAVKMPSKHMGDGRFTSDIEAYEIPGVPWVCFFEPVTGVATHGTYWHRNFGTPMSKGCINMVSEEAQWLFRWCDPKVEMQEFKKSVWDKRGFGTKVVVY